MNATCPTTEAVEYLRIKWAKYERMCRDRDRNIDTHGERSNSSRKNNGRGQRTGQRVPPATPQGDKEPKIKKELCPDTLTKDSTPIEFRKFQRAFKFLVYYKESYMDKASPEGQKHYLLKCIDAELGEWRLALTDATTPIFDEPNNPTKSVMTHLIEEFNRRFPVTNRQKDFFLQSQGPQKFTAYIDKLWNMAVEADLANATAEDLIVVMAIVGCRKKN